MSFASKVFIAFLPFAAFSQTEVADLFEELPGDTVEIGVDQHHSLKPYIRHNSGHKGNYIELNALSDLNYFQEKNSSVKGGLGFSLRSSLRSKWFFDLKGIQGLSNFGRYEPMSFLRGKEKNGLYAYTDIRSRISYTPNHLLHFQAGVDHHFLGEGNRSLLLSDYGRPYPFGSIRAKFWRVEYSILYQFMHEEKNDRRDGKFASSHHLSLNLAKWWNIGIFESVIFQPKDSSLNRGFDVEYLNPLIFYRPQEYSLGSSDNVLLGLDMSIRFKKQVFYTQLLLDEFSLAEIRAKSGWWASKYAIQVGFKGHANNKWFYRAEYNFVRPYTYSHLSSDLNYGNQGSVLAHPYGANFMEILGEFKFTQDRWLAKFFVNYYMRGGSRDGFNYGEDIYQAYINRPYEYGHVVGSGIQENGISQSICLAYRILNHGKMHAFIENQFRYSVQQEKLSHLFVVGLRSFLWNDYRNY